MQNEELQSELLTHSCMSSPRKTRPARGVVAPDELHLLPNELLPPTLYHGMLILIQAYNDDTRDGYGQQGYVLQQQGFYSGPDPYQKQQQGQYQQQQYPNQGMPTPGEPQ